MRPARAVAALLLALAIGACTGGGRPTASPGAPGSAPGPPRPPSGDVVVAYPEEPLSLNPYLHAGRTNATRDLLRPVLPTLLSIRPDLSYGSGLALRVPSGRDVGGDPFTVTFRLDPKAVWSDGTPITSADVRFTWEAILDRRWPVAERSRYRRITEVIAANPHTVRLVFDAPYPSWPDLFSAGDFVLPKHALEGRDFGAEWGSTVPVSGGPFVLEARTPGLEIVYVPNTRWWRRAPGLARVRVQIVPDVQTAIQLLEGGRVQVVVTTTQVNLGARLKRLDGVQSSSAFGAAWWELAFNTERRGADDQAFRRAVAHGIDRAGIVEALVRGDGRELQHLLPGRKLALTFGGLGHDPGRSRELLRGAGYRQGEGGVFAKEGVAKLSISAPSGNDLAEIVQRAVQFGLRGAGVELDQRNPESDRFYGEWREQGRFDLALWEQRGTPLMPLAPDYHSALRPPGGVNYTRLLSEPVDRGVEAADRGPAPDLVLVSAAMRHLADAVAAIPLFEAKAYVGHRSSVRGPSPNATVDGPLWNLQEWTVGE